VTKVPRVLLWAIPGFAAWAVLQTIAVRWFTGWREEKAKGGFLVLGLLAWWLPTLLIGETGASEVEQAVLIAGFPIAAAYLVILLIAELSAREDSEDADG
jgi:hypothetical protein